MTKKPVALLCAAVGLLAACATHPPAAPPAPASQTPGGTMPAPPEPAPPQPSGPVSAAAQKQAQQIVASAIGLLEAGNEEQAKTELRRALLVNPNNDLAPNLLAQIDADPLATLGRESFAYVVKPNDSLSGIAERFLHDKYKFYILARYNDIKVPRQLSSGQTIRVPGKAPPPETHRPEPAPRPEAKKEAVAVPVTPPPPAAPPPPPEPSPGEKAMSSAQAAERAGNLEKAYGEYHRAAGLDQAGAAEKAAQLSKQLANRYAQQARSALAKQDLDGAISAWNRVLEYDPGNDTARLERQRAITLKEKLGNLKD
ncbi:MAG TPA: LysM peptidoglycan-binding domain-containing protein [Methylibium sp.]